MKDENLVSKLNEMTQLTSLGQTREQFLTITSYSQLYSSWKLVKANRGAAGVDGESLEEFEGKLSDELKKLSVELRNWNYSPQAVKRVEIPKPGSKDKRKLGIPTVRDRVVQQSIRLSLEPLYEPEFSKSSFGFRPGIGAKDAIAAAQRIQKESGKEWIVDIDLEKFFDRINHERLINHLGKKVDKQTLRLIGLTLRSGVMCKNTFEATKVGSPQGSPLSPLLSNIVLDELDKELESRGLEFCRYADDAKIFVGSPAAGNRVMRSVSRFIEKKLKLSVNLNKSKIARAKEVIFLGFVVTSRAISISKRSMRRAYTKLREMLPRRTHIPIDEQIKRLNLWYRGWVNYYELTNFPRQLQMVEGHIRRRLRAQLISHSKRKRFLVRKLIKLGVNPRMAAGTVYNENRKVWKLSITKAAHIAWDNKWFEAQRVLELSNRKLKHWKKVKVRVW